MGRALTKSSAPRTSQRMRTRPLRRRWSRDGRLVDIFEHPFYGRVEERIRAARERDAEELMGDWYYGSGGKLMTLKDDTKGRSPYGQRFGCGGERKGKRSADLQSIDYSGLGGRSMMSRMASRGDLPW